MGYAHPESVEVLDLSRAVREWEAPEADPGGPAYKVNLYVGNDYDGGWEAAHPLVEELVRYDKDAVSGALAYMAEGSTSDAPALIRWMMAGAFKGKFESDAAFCKDQFTDAVDDHFATWVKRVDVGLPEVELSSLIDWEEVAYIAVGGPCLDRDDQVFYSVEASGGVYVFDASIRFSDYENDEE